MTTTYSPHHDGGGTLHLPSPTHLSRTDSTSTLAQLRRSLSKSPSKHSAFRLLTSNSASPSPRSPLLPQPRASSVSLPADENALGSSPLAAAFPHSATKTRPPMRRLSPMSTAFGSDLPRSPAKRPLSECTDNGNATPQSSAGSSSGGEKESSSPVPIASSGSKDGRKGPSERRDQYLSPNVARVRKDRPIVGFSDISVKSSPLKRSDESSNQDLIRMGSPAKRRSLHFPSIGSDFDIFDQSAMQQQTQMGRSNSETLSAESPTRSEFARSLSPLPKRASSLRKTTLQQRHDKPTYPKAKPNASLALEMQTPGPANMKSRQRLSLDNQIPHPDRGSPFSNMGGLPNASVHPIHSALNEATVDVPKAPVAKHPLSRTLTTSSTSSFGDDSPTHIPIHHAEPRKPRHDFSKSLPLGAARPASKAAQVPEPLSQETDFSTPENYKLAKPLPAAFMSTGLISKRQKNLSQDQLDFSGSLGHMPDTPCKRAPNVLAAGPAPTPKVHAPKMQHSRPFAHAFGTPSTPINSNRAAPAPSALGKGTSIFGSSFNQGNLTRRGSFISDEGSGSPLAMFRNSTVMAPPTPTKQPVPVDETPSTEVDMHDATTPGREGSESPFLELNSSPIFERHSRKMPQTPSECMVPPDPSSLSISGPRGDNSTFPPTLTRNNSSLQTSSHFPPATPTAHRDSLGRVGSLNTSVTPVHHHQPADIDAALTSRFDKVEVVGNGEFSQVFRVTRKADSSRASARSGYFAPSFSRQYSNGNQCASASRRPQAEQVWAVKKARNAFLGPRDRKRKMQEVEALRALGHDSAHTLHFFDSWETNGLLYIQTEYCDEKSLDAFLDKVGRKWRLDDFRIWKIMLELSLGLKHIHDSGFIHLDLKPANVLITFEGALKIADFGLASPWPAPPGIEGEGDREYIGPEILLGRFDKPADIFALGLILLEIAGNVMLPDNGISWQRLRSGDMSDVPSLTWGSDASALPPRDDAGNPLDFAPADARHPGGGIFSGSTIFSVGELCGAEKPHFEEQTEPPDFAVDPAHEHALDRLVGWMIQPISEDRPVVDELLATPGIQWARSRRRAGATVYEGDWGPADEVLANDQEMMMLDVL